MSLEDIPEIPPHPKIHSIHLYHLPDAFALAQNLNQRSSQLTAEVVVGAVCHTFIMGEGAQCEVLDAGLNSPFIPECSPIPLRHDIALYSSSEVAEPIPDTNTGSQQMSITLNPMEPDIEITAREARDLEETERIHERELKTVTKISVLEDLKQPETDHQTRAFRGVETEDRGHPPSPPDDLQESPGCTTSITQRSNVLFSASSGPFPSPSVDLRNSPGSTRNFNAIQPKTM